MQRYLAGRILQLIVVVFLALSAVFFLQFLAGDPVILLLPMDATFEEIDAMRERLGFNDSIFVQYFRFVSNALRGDFGPSLRHPQSAVRVVFSRIPATLELALIAVVTSLIIAIPIGVISAAYRGSVFDQFSIVFTVFGQAVPGFWLGIICILLFAVTLEWLPTGGRGELRNLVLPTITLTAFYAARFARMTRSTVLDVLNSDYIRTARAKGLSESRVLYKHALRNASISIITLLGLQLGQLLGGAVVTETVFYWPGLGRLLIQSLLNRDFPVVFTGVFFIAVVHASLNLIVDLVYMLVDPRISYQ